MLVSVPLMAYVKVFILNESVPAVYRNAILVFLEGDSDAPLRHRTGETDRILQDGTDLDQRLRMSVFGSSVELENDIEFCLPDNDASFLPVPPHDSSPIAVRRSPRAASPVNKIKTAHNV